MRHAFAFQIGQLLIGRILAHDHDLYIGARPRRIAFDRKGHGAGEVDGEFGVPCPLIIGRRSESTDRKVSLNAALRTFGVEA